MSHPYKIIVSNNNIHREFEIHEDMEKVLLGTSSSCEFRLESTDFFTDIEVAFLLKDDQWYVLCNDSIYLNSGDIRKLSYSKVDHGDHLQVRYADNGAVAFDIFFAINFEVQLPAYNLKIDLADSGELIIGSESQNSNITLNSKYCDDTCVILKNDGNKYSLEEKRSNYGVNVNGTRITQKTELKNHDFFSVSDIFFYLKEDCIYTDCNKVSIKGIQAEYLEKSVFKYPVFVRNTRRKVEVDTTPIKVLDPSQKPTKPEINILTSLLPMVMMLVLIIVVRGFLMSTGGSFIIFSACSMGIGVITSIISMAQGRKKYKKDIAERKNVYTRYIEDKEAEIKLAREQELNVLNEIYRGQTESISKVLNFESDIFDRIPEDDDYMNILLGYGKRKAGRIVEYKKQDKLEENDELAVIPEQIENKYRYIDNAPIVLSLKEANAIGITGTAEDRYEMFKSLLADLICRHFSNDMELFVLTDENVMKFEWIKRLPQLQRADGKRNIVFDSDTRTNTFDYLYKELSARSEEKLVTGKNIIVFTLDNNGIYNHPISKYIQYASQLKTTFIFFESSTDYLPLYCSKVIELTDICEGEYYSSEDRTKLQSFKYTKINDDTMKQLVEMIAPVCSEEVSLASTLRKNYSMFEMLGIYDVNDIDFNDNWGTSEVYRTMAAPIGINSKNEIVELDLHEKAHGPHGLVAGTTGSGKSEILQTYILSMAVRYHPYEVSFVIIDFKGGGMVNQFADLPHLVGAITNIDGKEIDRSLKSIKAELLKRQTLFADAGVNHIDKYIAAYKDGRVKTPLPHLIIIVDEFAELKAEQPEFMKELISASRIGRSLGVHLILATQKPAGQVNDQIWSNSRFKLCLKVQDQQDSKEVIKSPVAAEIKEPGRAYLQVGNNEIFELFQSAYSGGFVTRDSSENSKKFTIYKYCMDGINNILIERKEKRKITSGATELEALVSKIKNFCDENDIEKLPDICMKGLSDTYQFNAFLPKNELDAIPIGIYDDPDHQYQGILGTDAYRENTLIVGSSQMGKTNLLQVMIRFLSMTKTPEELNLYLLDFGAMSLKNFEELKHVGGVVLASDDEKLKNLFKLLEQELDNRKQKLLSAGVGSFFAYVDAGLTDMPKIIVMLDNFNAFREIYIDKYEQSFIRLCRDGVSLGISIVATNPSSTGIGFRYMSNFSNRLVLTCNESSDYSALLTRCRMEPKPVPGRLLFQKDKEIYEAQTYLAFEGDKEIDRANAVRDFVISMNEEYSEYQAARQIPAIPDVLTFKDFKRTYWSKMEKYDVPIGLDYQDIEPVVIKTKEDIELVVMSKKKEKSIKLVGDFISTVHSSGLYGGLQLFVLDDIDRSFNYMRDNPLTIRYSIEPSETELMLDATIERLEKTKQSHMNGGGSEKGALNIIIINSKEAVEYMSQTKPVFEKYKTIVNSYKSYGILFIYTAVDNSSISYNAPEILKRLKDSRKVLYLDNIGTLKLFDVTSGQLKAFSKDLTSDEGYWINGSEIQKTKLFS